MVVSNAGPSACHGLTCCAAGGHGHSSRADAGAAEGHKAAARTVSAAGGLGGCCTGAGGRTSARAAPEDACGAPAKLPATVLCLPSMSSSSGTVIHSSGSCSESNTARLGHWGDSDCELAEPEGAAAVQSASFSCTDGSVGFCCTASFGRVRKAPQCRPCIDLPRNAQVGRRLPFALLFAAIAGYRQQQHFRCS